VIGYSRFAKKFFPDGLESISPAMIFSLNKITTGGNLQIFEGDYRRTKILMRKQFSEENLIIWPKPL